MVLLAGSNLGLPWPEFQRGLELAGALVLRLGPGSAVLRLLDAFQPDALVTEFALGDHSGIEIGLAARARRPQLPVLVVSAAWWCQDEARQAGFAFKAAPVDPRGLAVWLRRALPAR